MKLGEFNPFVRNAIRADRRYFQTERTIQAYDHRIFYACRGSGTITWAEVTAALGKGDLVLIRPAVAYRLTADGARGLELLIINFDITGQFCHLTQPFRPVATAEYDPALALGRDDLADEPALNQPLILRALQHLETDLQAVVHEFTERKIFYREKASGLLKKLLAEIARAASIRQGSYTSHTEVLVNETIQYIRSHYPEEDLDNRVIAATTHYHPYTINHAIKATTGLSLHRYLTRYRMHIALDLLLSTRLTVTQIAEQVGYKTQAHFSAAFKKEIGKSPSAYRQDYTGL
jgi:AraC-like DNA-binding protein